MKFNPESVRPDDPGAKQDPAPNPLLTMSEVAAIIGARTKVETPNTFTERVLMFLDHNAA